MAVSGAAATAAVAVEVDLVVAVEDAAVAVFATKDHPPKLKVVFSSITELKKRFCFFVLCWVFNEKCLKLKIILLWCFCCWHDFVYNFL